MRTTAQIDAIEVGDRARVDLGDLTDLIESIKSLGLLQPIVVTTDNRLIAGHRRLESCRQLGMTEVPVVVAAHIHDAVDLLKAERDENTCRKAMTASELISLGRQVEALERPKAGEAIRAAQERGRAKRYGGDLGFVPANEAQRYDSREKAAEAVGLSSATYSRIKQVANAAEGFEESRGQRTEVTPERQAESKEALKLMDRITAGEEVRPAEDTRPETVTAVYEKWKGHKANRGREAPTSRQRREPAAEPAAAAPFLDARGRRMPQRSHRKSLNEGIATISGLCAGLAGITDLDDSLDAVEVAQWVRDLSAALPVLRNLNNKLKEHLNGNG